MCPGCSPTCPGCNPTCPGELGNLYHHVLLASMRRNKGASPSPPAASDVKRDASTPPTPPAPVATGYSVPQGGLFPLVAAPHYLFEIVAWVGIALAAQQARGSPSLTLTYASTSAPHNHHAHPTRVLALSLTLTLASALAQASALALALTLALDPSP